MKKLASIVSVVLFLFGSVFADSWKSVIYDNVVNSICIAGNTVYTATNGGVEVFSKDGSNLPGESTPWKIYTTQNSGLPHNNVGSIATIDMAGNFYVGGDNWLAYKVGTLWQNLPVQSTEEIKIDPDGIKWAIMTMNNKRGLYRDGGMGWENTLLNASVPLADLSQGTSRIAIGSKGKGMDSAFCTVWGTFPNGIYSYDLMSGAAKVWQVGKELIAGSPLDIAVSGNRVIAAGEQGAYIFAPGEDPEYWVLAYNDSMPKNSGGSVAYSNGNFYLGQRDGGLWVFNSGWRRMDETSGIFYQGINCLATDGEKLYIGSNNKMWIYNDTIFSQKSVTGINYPHGNDITFIAKIENNNANSYGGLILASTLGNGSASYGYVNNADAPSFSGSANVICGGGVTSLFVDKTGMMWTGFANGTLTKDGGSDHQWINLPPRSGSKFWLVGDLSKNLWLVTTDSSGKCGGVYSDAGQGTWANQVNTPANLMQEKVLSVNSTGKRVWIATDSSLYSYDFSSNWTYKRLGYSPYRSVAGEWRSGLGLVDDEISRVWVADGGYQGGASDVKYIDVNSTLLNGPSYWPYTNRKPTCIFVDNHLTTWVGTDSGVYYHKLMTSWQAVPLRNSTGHNLADDYVNTIYVDSATDAVWFGTAGGLTVWHQSAATSVKPAQKTINLLQKNSSTNVKYFDVRGREIASCNIRNMAHEQIFVREANGAVTKMNMNFNRLR